MSQSEVVSFGVEVHSDDVAVAARRLDNLEKSGQRAATATEKFKQSFTATDTATAKLIAALKKMER